MKLAGKIGCAILGTFGGLIVLGALGVPNPGQPALVMGFGGAGAVAGLLVVPAIVTWIRGAFVEEPPKGPGP